MATGTRQSNTMSEGLRKLLGDIADLKLTEDADLPFLINLETMVLQRLKGGADQAMQGGGGAPAGLMGTPAPPPGMAPGGGMMPAGMPGLMQGPQMPNPDELRRTLGRANVAARLPATAAKVAGLS